MWSLDPSDLGFLLDLEDTEEFIESSFPIDNLEHFKLRMELQKVMTSQWKIHNEMEPDEQMLLQFTLQSEDGKWYCLFQKDSEPCGSIATRKQHIKNHIRTHINHLPF